MDTELFEGRKREHIQLALDPAHQTSALSGLDRIHLFHDALPELHFSEVWLEESSFGRRIRTPFYVAGMTAGHPDAEKLNQMIARSCAARGWAMGVGSQRRDLESGAPLDNWKRLREVAPELELFANLGLSQLIGAPLDRVRALVTGLGARAICVHLNALQEVIQPEGTPHFRGGVKAIRELTQALDIPVVIKETGSGISHLALRKLEGIRIAALDVSGLGGTHWGRIEGARAVEKGAALQSQASQTFSDWGEPTVDSVLAARKHLPEVETWASGGVRTGLDAAKLIALGARRVGFAKPVLEAALNGERALLDWMELREFELRTALFCTGSGSPEELRRKEKVWTARD